MSTYLTKIIGSSINLIAHISPSYAAKLAVLLFSMPRKAKLNDEAKVYLNTAKQEDLDYEKFKIKTYQWVGKKDTILLIHGWDSNAFRWKDLIDILKHEDYNIICIDAPAHGASGSKIFNAPLYSECINVVVNRFNPSIIIGHSVGGTAAVIAQKNHNLTSIKKLILLGAPSNLAISVQNYVKMMGYTTKVSKAINQYYLKHFNHLPEYYCPENFCKNIQAKGLIIHDKKDRIISFKEALDIHRVYKNSQLIKTMGLGHRLKSDKVYQYILDFLND
ncbi:alpha/beta hydrolase [Sabulilitoribacter multivorans]|uniref:Alpha/beta hydrolase n=1 Tax=Flaviramulus multivorans TaxID=1304750 RepID=A0ABS9IKK0_9FLAO|nr:alpha/beta hydrolase [Flaviramulus multivorans]MCF7561102.1 alpha/beta hydrolase [Flaviramulus multivorans]